MIKFTQLNGGVAYVNPHTVTHVLVLEGNTYINFVDGGYITVKETEDEVVQKLSGEKLNTTGRYAAAGLSQYERL